MTGVRTVLIAQVVLIYMQTVETISQKHVIRVDFVMIRIDPSQFYFISICLSELIRPGLAVRVDPVQLL